MTRIPQMNGRDSVPAKSLFTKAGWQDRLDLEAVVWSWMCTSDVQQNFLQWWRHSVTVWSTTSPQPPVATGYFEMWALQMKDGDFYCFLININLNLNSSVQLLSCVWLGNPMDCSTPDFPVYHQLLELAQTHVHRVGDAIQPSHPLLPLLILPSVFPSIRVFSNESVVYISWPKKWRFSFSISPSIEYSGLISFRMDCLDLLAVHRMNSAERKKACSTCSSLWFLSTMLPLLTCIYAQDFCIPQQRTRFWLSFTPSAHQCSLLLYTVWETRRWWGPWEE